LKRHDPGVLVIGTGLTGLSAASELAQFGPVTVVERLPAPGGQAGFESPEVRRLFAECAAEGVRFVLGSTALRWSAGQLLVVGPRLTTWLEGSWLVFAGGSRPATPAEIGLLGRRVAGVYSATVAHHLLEAGVTIGRRPVVSGYGDWVDVILPQLRHLSAQITLVGGGSCASAAPLDVRHWPGYRPVQVHGFDRVNRVTVTDGQSTHEIACDAVVLAGDLRPLRNVDGAIRDGAARTSFIQPTRIGMDARAVIDFARTEAARVHSEMEATR